MLSKLLGRVWSLSRREIKFSPALKDSFVFQQLEKRQIHITKSGYAFLAVPFISFCLGSWYMYRLRSDINMAEQFEALRSLPPIELPKDLCKLATMEFRKIQVKGKFKHDKEVYLFPRTLHIDMESVEPALKSISKHGAYVITPFDLSDRNETILINRGWVPAKYISPNTRLEGQVEGEVTLTGLVRMNENGLPLASSQHYKGGRFFAFRNIGSLAEMLETAPVLIDATAESTLPGGPIGGQTKVTVRSHQFSCVCALYLLCAISMFYWHRKYLRKTKIVIQ